MVIDLENGKYGTVTQGEPENIDHIGFGHIGHGRITNCSTDEFHCLYAGLFFVLPKNESSAFELGDNRHCKVVVESPKMTVSCFVDDQLVLRLRKTEMGIDQVEEFFPDEPEFNAVFKSFDQPLSFPLCQQQFDALPRSSHFAAN